MVHLIRTIVYEFDLEEAHVSQIMIQQSQLSYLLADSSKRDARASYRISEFSEIDYMISDYAKPQDCLLYTSPSPRD